MSEHEKRDGAARFTPGPWGVRPALLRKGGGTIYHDLGHGNGSVDVAVVADKRDNALIASSPDLYAALAEAVEVLWDVSHGSGDPDDASNTDAYAAAYRRAKAALRKARGEE